MTPAEIRKHIIELKEGVKATAVSLEHLHKDQSVDREAFRNIDTRLSDLDKRLHVLGTNGAETRARVGLQQSNRWAFWAGVIAAIISAFGAIVAAIVAVRK